MSRDDGTGACIAVTDYMHYAIINTPMFSHAWLPNKGLGCTTIGGHYTFKCVFNDDPKQTRLYIVSNFELDLCCQVRSLYFYARLDQRRVDVLTRVPVSKQNCQYKKFIRLKKSPVFFKIISSKPCNFIAGRKYLGGSDSEL